MTKFEKRILLVMIMFYFVAGLNHFIHPEVYAAIIPTYLPLPELLNAVAGFAEITFALLLFSVKTRKWACWGIILMLVAFMPAHIFMIEKAKTGSYLLGKFTITPLIAWLRIPLQIIFILWAYWCSKMKHNLTGR